jgi:hypothetical protein
MNIGGGWQRTLGSLGETSLALSTASLAQLARGGYLSCALLAYSGYLGLPLAFQVTHGAHRIAFDATTQVGPMEGPLCHILSSRRLSPPIGSVAGDHEGVPSQSTSPATSRASARACVAWQGTAN